MSTITALMILILNTSSRYLRTAFLKSGYSSFALISLHCFERKNTSNPWPLAIRSSDSGKTSLFSPVFQIAPLSRIARVTRQKSFNKSMIDSSIEVIFPRRASRGHEAARSEKLLRLLSDRAQTLHNDRTFYSKQSYRFFFLHFNGFWRGNDVTVLKANFQLSLMAQ